MLYYLLRFYILPGIVASIFHVYFLYTNEEYREDLESCTGTHKIWPSSLVVFLLWPLWIFSLAKSLILDGRVK
jgi:hypothetical protein